MDVLTVTLVGPETIELGGQKVQAVRLNLRPAEDREEFALWLDSAGQMLREDLGEGQNAERSTRDEVLRRFPAARGLLPAIDAAAPTSQPAAPGKGKK